MKTKLLVLLALTGCNKGFTTPEIQKIPTPCSVTQDSAGVEIKCVDGSVATIPAQSCTVTQTAASSTLTCTDGTTATIPNGTNGQNGTSCSVSTVKNVTTISCTDGTKAVINENH